MNDDIKISVIMAVFNCEKTIDEAIDSIIKQTYTNWEFIICDDASTDSTYEIIKSYKQKYPDKIVLIKNETNSKLAYSLNHCLKYVSGEYVARMDGDDISVQNRLEIQLKFLKEHPEFDLVSTAMIPFDENGARSPMIGKKVPNKYDLRKGSCFYHATILVKKNVFERLGGYVDLPRTLRVEDFDLWFRFFEAGFKGINIPEKLYLVRVSINDFKRRTFRARINSMKTALHGYWLLKIPFYYYIFAFKPIVAGLVPKKFMFKYHEYKFSKKNKLNL